MHFYLEKVFFFCIVLVYSFFLILVKILIIWLNYIMSLVSSSQNEFTYIDLHSRCHIISEIVSINNFWYFNFCIKFNNFSSSVGKTQYVTMYWVKSPITLILLQYSVAASQKQPTGYFHILPYFGNNF